MSVDTKRIKRLYEKYGSLEDAVLAKQKELADISLKVKETQNTLSREEQNLQNTRKEDERLRKEAERLRQEIQSVKYLQQIGFTLETLGSIDKITKKFGEVNAVIDGLKKYKSLNEMDRKIASKEKKRDSLDSEIGGKKLERDRLSKRIGKLKDAKSTLESSVKPLETSVKALEDAKDGLKTEIGRLKSEKTGIENELKPMRQELADTPQQIEKKRKQLSKVDSQVEQLSVEKQNLEGDVARLSSEKAESEKWMEEQRWTIESCKAIATLMAAQRLEELKGFKEWVEKWVTHVSYKQPPTQEDIERAKGLITKRLMGKFRAYKCRDCRIRFVLEEGVENESGLKCPKCHSSYIYQDVYSMPERLLKPPRKSAVKLELETEDR